MNLCLSGLADCFGAAEYPNVVEEAVSRIQAEGPDAVTVNEACRADVVQIARRTAYHVRFVPVVYAGAPLSCVDPGGRGLFGLAVLTRRPVVRSESQAFLAQAQLEERRWLCVSTRDGVDVCTSHLEEPDSSDAAATNDDQCAELRGALGRRASGSTLFGGDVNRRYSCAPVGYWSRTDSVSHRSPGVQHVYGGPGFERPVVKTLPSAFSDHDMLLVTARGGGPGGPTGPPRRPCCAGTGGDGD
jgi:endonuclease/exonuclease/phosphatase family metal-dependent hydrolase